MSEILKILLEQKGFQIKCPNCGQYSDINKSNLFDIREPYPTKIKNFIGRIINKHLSSKNSFEQKIKEYFSTIKQLTAEEQTLKQKIKNKPKVIKTITRHVNTGQILEKILPGSKKFKYEQKDCRALFDPIDYIAFNGLTLKRRVDSITLIEIKSGDATLNKNQREARRKVQNKKIKFVEY